MDAPAMSEPLLRLRLREVADLTVYYSYFDYYELAKFQQQVIFNNYVFRMPSPSKNKTVPKISRNTVVRMMMMKLHPPMGKESHE